MPESSIFFYFFAAWTIASALLVIINRKPINSIVAMVLMVLGVAGNFFLLDAPFLATLLIMVYAGAIIVLFLFVIMLMEQDPRPLKRGWLPSCIFGGILILLFGAGSIFLFDVIAPNSALATYTTPETNALAYSSSPKIFGEFLFTKYVFLVEVIALLLLAAMAAVFMLHSKKKTIDNI